MKTYYCAIVELADGTLQLAGEWWRASGPRTAVRLSALVVAAAETYFGPSVSWRDEHSAVVRSADELAAASVRPWELGRD